MYRKSKKKMTRYKEYYFKGLKKTIQKYSKLFELSDSREEKSCF